MNIIQNLAAIITIIYGLIKITLELRKIWKRLDPRQVERLKQRIYITKWVVSLLSGILIFGALFIYEMYLQSPIDRVATAKMILFAVVGASWFILHLVSLLFTIVEGHQKIIEIGLDEFTSNRSSVR